MRRWGYCGFIVVVALFLGGCDTFFETVEPATPDPDAPTEVVQAPRESDATEVVTATREAAEPARPVTRTLEASALSGEPLPGDMLTAEEADRAIALTLDVEPITEVVGTAVDRDALMAAASGAPEVSALADLAGEPNYRVVYAQRLADKDADGRAAEVVVYRYDTGEALRSVVDLATGEAEVVDLPEGFPVPMTPAEIAEAAIVARADEDVRSELEAAGLDPQAARATGLLTRSVEAGDRCAEHRCLRLFFVSLRQPTPTFSVVVDLVDMEVVEIEPMPERSQP